MVTLACTMAPQASQNGNDHDGRHYTIAMGATDVAGDEGSKSATVTAPLKQDK
jgi:hypothetical protein